MKVKVYEYAKCSTCRNSLKWLNSKGIETETVDIFNHPPNEQELVQLVRQSGLDLKKFFNTSGEVYKELKLKDKLPSMSEQEQIALLASNGRLLKRPIVTDGSQVTVGFKEDDFARAWATH
jgi:arsenate reductase